MRKQNTAIKRATMRKRAENHQRTEAPFGEVQPLLAYAATHLDEDLSLAALAKRVGRSAFHLQRVFSSEIGETPKQLTLRLRLARAAVMLLVRNESILNVALSCGFQSHEAFIRAFRRHFGTTPSAYRARGFSESVSPAQAKHHDTLVAQVTPCVGLYHRSDSQDLWRSPMTYEIKRKQISPQPVLVIERRIKPADLAKTLGETLPYVVMHAQRAGLALAGQPFTRYLEWGPGLWTIEAGMPIVLSSHAPRQSGRGAGTSARGVAIREDTLPGGFAATLTHAGPYEGLHKAHAAVQQWIEAQGLLAGGAPWEVYVTDPADAPDPKDWKTDLFWPLAP